jgi:uncharacterized protein YbjT (DUF2867 family)
VEGEQLMSEILVTGSTGTVGAQVVAELLARGQQVSAAVRSGRAGRFDRSVSEVVFDFEDPSTFEGALAGVSDVFLMRPPQMSDSKAMRPFIDAMKTHSVEQVVFLSVQGAGSNLFVPHHGIEQYLKRSGLPWTFLRPSFFMQNLSTTHRADICERDEVFVPAGGGRTNFIDALDIAQAAAVALTTPGHLGKAYELTGSEALTYAEVAQALSEACGREITYPSPSAREFKSRMKESGCDADFVSVMGSIYLIAKLGMASGTTSELEELIGRPPTALREWAQRNVECFAPSSGQMD